MKRFLTCIGAFGAVFVLISCSSFNGSFNTYPITYLRQPVPDKDTPETLAQNNNNVTTTPASTTIPALSSTPPDTDVKVTEVVVKPCPVNAFAPMPPTPEIPFKELKAAGNNKDAIELVERKHIEELRAYISLLKRTQTKARLDFAAKCNASAK